MVDTTLNVVANILAESNYGGGDGGAAYAKTAMDDNDGVPMQAPYDSGIDMPLALKGRKVIKPLGLNMGARKWFDNGIRTPPTSFTQYVQDDRWVDAIINGYTLAAIPLDNFSQCIHWENANLIYDVFGVMPTKWTLDLDRGTNEEDQPFPKQITDIQYFNSATSGAYTVDSGFDTSQPQVNDDFSFTLTGSGSGAVALKWTKATVMIEAILNKKGTIGEAEVKYPYAIDYNIEVDLTFWDYDAILIEPLQTVATLEDWDLVMDLGTLTKDTLTIDNLFVAETDIHKFPEFGMIERSIKLTPGDAFVHTTDLTLA